MTKDDKWISYEYFMHNSDADFLESKDLRPGGCSRPASVPLTVTVLVPVLSTLGALPWANLGVVVLDVAWIPNVNLSGPDRRPSWGKQVTTRERVDKSVVSTANEHSPTGILPNNGTLLPSRFGGIYEGWSQDSPRTTRRLATTMMPWPGWKRIRPPASVWVWITWWIGPSM